MRLVILEVLSNPLHYGGGDMVGDLTADFTPVVVKFPPPPPRGGEGHKIDKRIILYGPITFVLM